MGRGRYILSPTTADNLAALLLGQRPEFAFIVGPRTIGPFAASVSPNQTELATYVEGLDPGGLAAFLEGCLAPSVFEGELDREIAERLVNEALSNDGLFLETGHIGWVLRASALLDLVPATAEFPKESQFRLAAMEAARKCDLRLQEGDFSGTVTSARTLVEASLREILRQTGKDVNMAGDLPKLCKLALRAIGMEAGAKDDPAAELFRGFVSLVNGLASLRNKYGDGHATPVGTEARHATLAVNASRTIVTYLSDSLAAWVGRTIIAGAEEVPGVN